MRPLTAAPRSREFGTGGVVSVDGDGWALRYAGAGGGIATGEVVAGELAEGVNISEIDGVDVVGAGFDAREAEGSIEADGGGVQHVGGLIHSAGGGGEGTLL